MGRVRTLKRLIRFAVFAVLAPAEAKRHVVQALYKRRLNSSRQREYVQWFAERLLNENDLMKQRQEAGDFSYRPLVSVIVPLYNTSDTFLRACLDSVLAQTYDNWELCLANDASPLPHVVKTVKEYIRKHKNIRFVDLKQNVHIDGASNEAIKLASGEFIALLDHDDILMPNALYENIKALNKDRTLDLIYSDEDKIDETGTHVEPFFKPDWSPEFLYSCNYITHFSILRRSVVQKIGGFRYGTEGAQDWDLFLRFTKQSTRIHHIPLILYSWRKSENSTASVAKSKPYAYINQKRVLRDAFAAEKPASSIFENKYMGFWRVHREILGAPLVSIIIPTKDHLNHIEKCVNSIIEMTSYAHFEIIIVDTGTSDQKVLDYYQSRRVKSNKITIVSWSANQFNYSAACNFGTKKAKGDYLVFLNNDTEVISSDWLEAMLEYAQQPDIGMVGCKLLFPNNMIQHAGVVLRKSDIAVHPFYGSTEELDIFTNIYISNVRDCLAVTAACSMVAQQKFNDMGGFNEKQLRVTYNDVDLCLRLIEAGYRNVYTPYSVLYHYESASIGRVKMAVRDQTELQSASKYMRQKWGKFLQHDPYYNDNFSSTGQPYFLRPR